MLERFNGTNRVHFALDSAVTGTTRVFENTDDLRGEIVNARVYGGMHYRFSAKRVPASASKSPTTLTPTTSDASTTTIMTTTTTTGRTARTTATEDGRWPPARA